MKIESLMQRRVRTCRPWDSALDALREMWDGDCGALPVIDALGRVVGMVTDRDLCMASFLRGRALHDLRIEDVASRPVVACLEDGSISVAHALMRRHQLRRLPVIDARSRLVGIVTLADVVRNAIDDPRPEEQRDALETVAAILERPKSGPSCPLPKGRDVEQPSQAERSMAQVVRDRQVDLEC
jgi:CBS domain-containing protein